MDGGELTLASYFVTGNGAFVGVWWMSRGMEGRVDVVGWVEGGLMVVGRVKEHVEAGWLAGGYGNLQAEARDWILNSRTRASQS
jgi:hypothetical protein